jgi:phosphoribosylamine--glycine ligase
MNIALIGSGGREHALCQKMYESSNVDKIVCLPGNAGTAKIAQNIDINILNFKNILNLVKLHKIDFVVVGPEEPLVKGLVNFLEKNKIKVFGPNKYASKLEGSKSFMKKICAKNKIPTAKFKICITKKQVINCLKSFTLPIVVKADGLAAGKGVTICKSKNKF